MLRGRYRLDVLIATGGMGEVWRSIDLAIERRVAVKVLRPEHADDEEGLARFRAEAHHAGSLSHPNIAQVFDYAEPVGGEPGYLVMELVEGLSLTRILDDGPLPPEDVMDIVAQSARGLAAAHRTGLVHRDIKPGNLLLRSDGLVKITDFGIAHADGETTVTQPGMLIGTPAYLAPERVAGAPATPAGDLYALGVVAHQCLTGHVPFAGEALAVALAHLDRGLPPLPPSVPPPVAALVADLTRKDPAARPPSAWDVALQAEHLRALLSSPEMLRLHGPAVAPLAVPGAESAVLAGAALPGAWPEPPAAEPEPSGAATPLAWTGSPPRPAGALARGSRRPRRRTGLPVRGALAATGLAAISFIAWTLATMPGQAGDHPPGVVAPPTATRSSAPAVQPRQSPLAATRNAGTGGGDAVVAQAAATPQPSRSPGRSSSSPSGSPAPPSSPGAPSDTPTPTPSSPTPTPTTPSPTPTTPDPTTPDPSTSTPTSPAPTATGGTLSSSATPSSAASVGVGLTLVSVRAVR